MNHHLYHLIVDAYSVIYAWDDLRKLHQDNLRKAQDELVRRLIPLHDFSEYRVTVVFDGRSALKPDVKGLPGEFQIIHSREHQTADAVIEQLVASFPRPERIFVVTDDYQERSTVESFGATVFGTGSLRDMITSANAESAQTLSKVQTSARKNLRS
ncbi:NYN domain-containing protein [Kamptonema cortianum]|nr:NYN domain-containing protein [Kamptonema cortianum]MDL5046267.1 NYN domain-containing protein [Oscillatoria amoena NRMC-F 0135]MDL5053912.1 NYN domain-containing protein [Oscillatoria laete-virens NRMC-F 0139]